jgi:uncharacterized membrane protein
MPLMPFLFAQSLLEYSGAAGSNATLAESIGSLFTRFWDTVRNMDQNTWIAIGGGLLVLAFMTRRSRRQ